MPLSITCKQPTLTPPCPDFSCDTESERERERLIGCLRSGSIVTAPVGAIISDRYGRKICMFSGAWVIILGAIIASTSSTLAQLTVGRFILGIGIQIMTVGAPAYAIEIAPPHWRGRCAGKTYKALFLCLAFCESLNPLNIN